MPTKIQKRFPYFNILKPRTKKSKRIRGSSFFYRIYSNSFIHCTEDKITEKTRVEVKRLFLSDYTLSLKARIKKRKKRTLC
jgi:hypothetical protein